MAQYSKLTIPLDNIVDRKQILDSGIALPDVTVLRLSAAAEPDVFLHFGEGKDAVDLSQGWAFHITPPETTGLYVSVAVAHPGEKLKLLLGYTANRTPEPTE
jgi:hypothetical protein